MAVSKETYDVVMECYSGYCDKCGGNNNVQLHHKMPRSKAAVKMYPLFIDSPINLVPLCGGLSNGCHEKYKSEYKIRDREAKMYEDWLAKL
jgi:hypothetical protein